MKPYYQDASVKIYHADCREMLATMKPGSVDLVLTDPPYGIGANKMQLGNGRRIVYRGERDWDVEAPDISQILQLPVDLVIWGGNYFSLPPSRGWLVWDKGTGSNNYADCELAWTTLDMPIRKLFISWVGRNAKEHFERDRFHPTQKPVALMSWCLGFFPAANRILDPFMGSGSTLRAAKTLGRKAIGIEIEEKYCEIAAKRMEQATLGLDL